MGSNLLDKMAKIEKLGHFRHCGNQTISLRVAMTPFFDIQTTFHCTLYIVVLSATD